MDQGGLVHGAPPRLSFLIRGGDKATLVISTPTKDLSGVKQEALHNKDVKVLLLIVTMFSISIKSSHHVIHVESLKSSGLGEVTHMYQTDGQVLGEGGS